MSNVIQMHRSTPAKVKGIGIAVACMANRYRLSPEESEDMAAQARALVERGHSPAHARSAMLRKVRRMAPTPVAA